MELSQLKPKIRIRDIGSRHFLGKRGYNPKGVVLHTMAGMTNASGDLYNWFVSPKSGGATHYGIGLNGVVTAYSSLSNKVSANSSKVANANYLSIEHADMGDPNNSTRTPQLYESSARLLAYLSIRFNWGDLKFNDNVFLHKQFHPKKSCPGGLDYERIIREANKWRKKYFAAQKKSQPGPAKEPTMKADDVVSIPEVLEPYKPPQADFVTENPKDNLNVTQSDMKRYTSRKFLVSIAMVILFTVLAVLEIDLDVEQVFAILAPALTYLGVEGVADYKERALKAEANGKEIAAVIDDYTEEM